MQHTQQDETILRTEPKEDIDDLIFRADPCGGDGENNRPPPPRGWFFPCHSLYNFHSFGYNMRAILWK